MSSEKFTLSTDDSDSDGASPAAKVQKLGQSSKPKRTGKAAQERRDMKNRERMNQRTYEKRLANCKDPQYLFNRTTNLEELENKFQRWDELLKNGGTIFDSDEVIGPILIETELLDEPAQDKHTMFMESRCDSVVDVTYYNLASDEVPDIDDSMSVESEPEEGSETVVSTVYEKRTFLGEVDLGCIPKLDLCVDLGLVEPMKLYGDLHTGGLYVPRTTVVVRPVPRPARSRHPPRIEVDSVINVKFKGMTIPVSNRPVAVRPTSPTLGAMECDFNYSSYQEETFDVEIFRRYEDTVAMWHCSGVRRVLLSNLACSRVQYHPLTRKELFKDWDVVMCIYHANSLGDYVRDVVQVYREPGPSARIGCA